MARDVRGAISVICLLATSCFLEARGQGCEGACRFRMLLHGSPATRSVAAAVVPEEVAPYKLSKVVDKETPVAEKVAPYKLSKVVDERTPVAEKVLPIEHALEGGSFLLNASTNSSTSSSTNSSTASAASNLPVPPMAKVTQMLQEMLTNSKELKAEADQQHAAQLQACTESKKAAQTDLADLDMQIETLEAQVTSAQNSISTLKTSLTTVDEDLRKVGQALEILREEHAQQEKAFAEDLLGVNEALAAVTRTRQMLPDADKDCSYQHDGLPFVVSIDRCPPYNAACENDFDPTASMGAQCIEECTFAMGGWYCMTSTNGGWGWCPEQVTSMLQTTWTTAQSKAVRNSVASGLLQKMHLALEISNKYQPDGGGLAKDDSLFDEFKNLSTAQSTEYSAQGASSVAEVLCTLQQDFEKERNKLVESTNARRPTFTNSEQALLNQLKTNGDTIASDKESLAAKSDEVVAKQEQLKDTTATRQSAADYSSTLEKTCDEKNQAYTQVREMRQGEITALTKALEIITGNVISSAEVLFPSLLKVQLTMSARSGKVGRKFRWHEGSMPAVSAAGEQQKILGFLRVKASKLRSMSLSRLVGQVGAIVSSDAHKSDDDPLAEVKAMISDLIIKMQKQATEEATQKAWCDGELAKNDKAQTESKADIEARTAKIEQLTGSLQKMDMEETELNATLAKGNTDRPTMVQQRANEKQTNEATIQDAVASASAVNDAIAMLEEFYANVSKLTTLLQTRSQNTTTNTSTGTVTVNSSLPEAVSKAVTAAPLPAEGQSVIMMLQEVRDRFTALAEATRTKEAEAAAESVKLLQEHDVAMATAEKDRDYSIQLQAMHEQELSEARSNLNTSNQELTDALATYEKLKPACVDTETYEQKAAKRQAEIDALEETLTMLDEYAKQNPSSFLSLGSSSDVQLGVANATAEAEELKKVKELLEGMRTEVATDLASDQTIYSETKTWCEQTLSQKQSVMSADAVRDRELTTEIETSVQLKAQLDVEIEKLQEELKSSEASLTQSIALREKQMEDFRQNEKEMMEAISALEHALVVLNKHYSGENATTFNATEESARLESEKASIYSGVNVSSTADSNQTAAQMLMMVAGVIKKSARLLPSDMLTGMTSEKDGMVLQEFLRSPEEALSWLHLDRKATLTQTGSRVNVMSNDDGHQIYGILEELLAGFQADLKDAQDREATDATAYTGLKESKKSEVTTMEGSLAVKQDQLVNAMTTLAQAKEDLAFLRASRSADLEYLLNLQTHCTEMESEFQVRNKTRAEEISAIDKAVEVVQEGIDAASVTSAASSVGTSSFLLHGAGSKHPILHHSRNLKMHIMHKGLPAKAISRHMKMHSNPSRPKAVGSIMDAYIKKHRSLLRPHSSNLLKRTKPLLAKRSGGSTALANGAAVAVKHYATPVSAAGMLLTRRQLGPGHDPSRRSSNMFSPSRARRLGISDLKARVLDTERPRPSKRLAVLAMEFHTALGEKALPSSMTSSIESVVTQIATMITTLGNQKNLEIKMRDTCIAEKQQATMQAERRTTEVNQHTAKISQLEMLINRTADEVAELENEVAQLNNSMPVEQGNRDAEHAEFKKTVEQQLKHQAVLQKTIAALQHLYRQQNTASFFMIKDANSTGAANASSQVNASLEFAPKEAWKTFDTPLEKHSGGKGVISILEMLIEKSESMVEAVVSAEEAAVDAHGAEMQGLRRTVEDKDKQIVVLAEKKGTAALELQQEQTFLKECEDEITEIESFVSVVDLKCSYLLEHFEDAQDARRQEIQTLIEARQTLQNLLV